MRKEFRVKGTCVNTGRARNRKFLAKSEKEARAAAAKAGITTQSVEEVIPTPEQIEARRRTNEKALIEIMGGNKHCPYCGNEIPVPTEIEPEWGKLIERDHMDPVSRGGWDHPDNFVYVCRPCNQKKRDSLYAEWIRKLPPSRQDKARALYIEKHCYQPEDFFPIKEIRIVAGRDLEPKEIDFVCEFHISEDNTSEIGYTWERWSPVFRIQ